MGCLRPLRARDSTWIRTSSSRCLKRGAVSDRLLDLFRGPTLPRHHLVTSQLTIAEILVDAIRDDDMQRNDLYLGFLRDIPNLMTVAPISRDVPIRAALIRARQPRIKLPDAI